MYILLIYIVFYRKPFCRKFACYAVVLLVNFKFASKEVLVVNFIDGRITPFYRALTKIYKICIILLDEYYHMALITNIRLSLLNQIKMMNN